MPSLDVRPPSSSLLESRTHPLESQVTQRVEEFFLDRWDWPNAKAKLRFQASGFGHSTCVCFPDAKDSRIEHVSKLITAVSLIHDLKALNGPNEYQSLIESLSCIHTRNADRSKFNHAAQLILYDVAQEMRFDDEHKTLGIMKALLSHLQCHATGPTPASSGIDAYLEAMCQRGYMKLLTNVLCYANDSPETVEVNDSIYRTVFEHMVLVNDIFSMPSASTNASQYPNAVVIYAIEHGDESQAGLQWAMQKIWAGVREREEEHLRSMRTVEQAQPESRSLLKALELLMSGNERWCMTTGRFH